MPVNKQLTEEPQIGIEPMTAPLHVASSSRFSSVAPSEAGAFQAPETVSFGQNARRSGEQVASTHGFTLSPFWLGYALVLLGLWFWIRRLLVEATQRDTATTARERVP